MRTDCLIVYGYPTIGRETAGRPYTDFEKEMLNYLFTYHSDNWSDKDIKFTYAIDNKRESFTDEKFNKKIEHLKPKLILTIGKHARSMLYPDQNDFFMLSVDVNRNCFYMCLPDIHELSYRSQDIIDFIQAFKKIDDLDNPMKRPVYKSITVIDNGEQANEILKNLTFVSCDIETTGLDWRTDKIIALGMCDSKDNVFIFNSIENYKDIFIKFFNRLDINTVWHNGQFDTKFLSRFLDCEVRIDNDTILQHYIIDERHGTHSLTNLSKIYLNMYDYEAEFKKHIPKKGTYADTPKEALHRYLAYDVLCTMKLYKIFSSLLDSDDKKVYDMLIRATNFLKYVEMNGLKLDTDLANKLDSDYSRELKDLEEELQSMAIEFGYRSEEAFNPNSYKQLNELLFDILHVRKKDNRKTADSGARAYWLDLYNEDTAMWKFVKKLDDYKKKKKLHSAYVKGFQSIVADDGRLYSNFLLFGTVTGRLASRNPNLQNIPRDSNIKNLITAEEGYNLIEVDYSQAELRVLAVLSDDSFLKEVYYKGEDLHSAIAEKLFGKDFTKEDRVKAKGVNFGIVYGITGYALSKQFGSTVDEATKILNDWFKNVPQASAFIKKTRKKIYTEHYVKSVFGRKRRFGFVQGEKNNLENEAINFVVQSVASDLTLLSAIEIYNKIKNIPEYIKIVNLVHDSILFEVKEGYEEDSINLIKGVMEELPKKLLNTDMPFIVDAGIEKSWGNVK